MSIESMFHWGPIFIAPSAKIMSQINYELIPGNPTGDHGWFELWIGPVESGTQNLMVVILPSQTVFLGYL